MPNKKNINTIKRASAPKNTKLNNISIAIDGNEANVTNRVGSNVYAFEIIKQLEKLTRKKSKKIPRYSVTILLSKPPIADFPKKRKGWQYKVITPRKFWTQWALPIHLFLNKKKYDVLFTPGHYAPRLSSVPYVSSIMDLAFLKYPEQFNTNDLLQLENWSKYSVKKAKKVITISEFSKQEIITRYKKNENDIVVVYPSTVFSQPASIKKTRTFFRKNKIKKPYFLYLGTIQPRKNIITVIEAFEKFSRSQAFAQLSQKSTSKRGARISSKKLKQTKPQLVIAGKIGWLADDIIEKIKKSPFKKQIITTGFVPDKFKQDLYHDAMCSILVGLYEGFGIPPLESLSMGTIPIVSNTSSLPEVVGDAGITVDPLDSSQIADEFKNIWTMTARQKAIYRKKSREQIEKFSWEMSAKIVLDTLTSVVNKGKY